jgi:TRAP-type mannitol/chloroaromatic compound transport system substrate-binding protein
MKRKTLFWMVMLIAACIIGIGGTRALAAEKAINWKMQVFMPAGTDLYKYCQDFCEKVKKDTKGRLSIKLFPAGALYPDIHGLKSVKAGVVQIAVNCGAYYQNIIPEAYAWFLPPFGLESWEDFYSLWYYGGMKELVDPLLEKHGVFAPVWFTIGADPIWSKVPIRSMEDFKGIKLRMAGSAAKFFDKKLGTSITMVMGPELYTALKLGTIDAAEYGGGALDYALGLHEVTKYMILPSWCGAGLAEFLVNKKAYDALPADVKTIFDLCCTWAEMHISLSMLRECELAKQKMVDKGMEPMWLPKEDVVKIRKMAREFWDEELASISPTAAKIIDLYKKKCNAVETLK